MIGECLGLRRALILLAGNAECVNWGSLQHAGFAPIADDGRSHALPFFVSRLPQEPVSKGQGRLACEPASSEVRRN